MSYQASPSEELIGGAPTGGALMLVPSRRESGVVEHSPEEWQALRETVAKGTTPAQFRVFMAACRSVGLDPFQKQVYCWTDSNQQGGITIYTSVAGLRALAKRTGHYRGQRGPYWCGADGQWTEEWIAATPPVAAKFGVVSDEWDDVIWAVVRMDAYKKTSGQWVKDPANQLGKTAESLALRRAFPDATSGVYSDAELGTGTIERPEDFVDADRAPRATVQPGTVQHAGRTVVEATGEVVTEGNEPNVFADEPAMPKWPEIQARAIAAGISLDDWAGTVREITGILPSRETMKRFTNQHKRDILRYIAALKEAKAHGETADDLLAEDLGESSWPVDGEQGEGEGQDNGDPDQLKNLPALQTATRP